MTPRPLLILFVIVLLGGCGGDQDSDVLEELPLASLPGVYSGEFPCDGCPGIAATLWLRGDGRFFFRQRYPADATRDETDTYNLGRWSSVDDERVIEAAGAGPRRTFMRIDADTLVMQTDSDLEHRLIRDASVAEFSDTIGLSGMMRMRANSASFKECLTGLTAPVSKGGDFARFRHQYRSAAGPSKPAYVELDGRFSWSGDGTLKSLTIVRFVTIKEGGTC